jgi:hypothetical protein
VLNDQVLPSRTRPPMNMNGASGFLLTGTKVYNEPPSTDATDAPVVEEQVEESYDNSSSRTSASPQKKKARTEEPSSTSPPSPPVS